MRNAFIRSLTAIARRDPDVMLLTGDLGFTVFEDFQKEFPGRYINMGVAEQNMIAVAAGLALSGKRVFVYSIIPFVTLRCLEHIRNDLCFHHLPVCIVGMGAGYAYGHMGPSHHALEDIAALRSMPGMTVIAPGDPIEAGAAVSAITQLPGPSYLRLGKNGEPPLHTDPVPFRIGKAIRMREGTDVAIASTGTTLEMSLAAAKILEDQGIASSVFSFPTISPLDEETLIHAAKHHELLVTVEEHRKAGGFGSAVSEILAAQTVRSPLLLCCAPDAVSHACASRGALLVEAELTPVAITDRILRALALKPSIA